MTASKAPCTILPFVPNITYITICINIRFILCFGEIFSSHIFFKRNMMVWFDIQINFLQLGTRTKELKNGKLYQIVNDSYTNTIKN